MTPPRSPARLTVPAALLAALLGAAALGQNRPAPEPGYTAAPVDDAARDSTLAALRDWEDRRRAATDFTAAVPGDRATGPDPYRIAALPGGDRVLVLLRGAGELLVMDGDAAVVQRLPAPASATGLAVLGEHVFVGGELAPVLATYRIGADGILTADKPVSLHSIRGIRDVAAGPSGVLYVVDDATDRLFAFRPVRAPLGWDTSPQAAVSIGHGPVQVRAAGNVVAVNTLLDHRVVVYPLNDHGLPQSGLGVSFAHDGPLWGFDLLARGDTILVAAGGVEDHPLDRTGGFFGHVDSYLYLYRTVLEPRRGGGAKLREPERLGAVNVSDAGAVTPKHVRIAAGEPRVAVDVYGYGGWQALRVDWNAGLDAPPAVAAAPVPAGITGTVDLPDGRRLAVSPLLDAVLLLRGPGGAALDPVPVSRLGEPADPERLLGEVLFFTGLMGPAATGAGPQSRFTCETCHFEGYVDGRIHFTGRGNVHAVTKPLRGLFNNKPHFSRALDEDLTEMVDNEFRVACAETGLDPWFTLRPAAYPGLGAIGLDADAGPGALRRALMTFLMEFGFAPNPFAGGRDHWSAREAIGAEVFSRRCEGCHQARLVADDPATRLPVSAWEALIFSDQAPIVWASDAYELTGVEPYVHARGTRVPSLRRLYRKYPYFTNGSAETLREVVDRARFLDDRFYHDGAPLDRALEHLSEEDQRNLLAFLALL